MSALAVSSQLARITADLNYRETRAALRRRLRPIGTEVAETGFDPLGERVLADPYPAYRRLLDGPPIAYARRRGVWIVSHYDAVRDAGRDHHRLSAAEGIIRQRHRLPMLVTIDRPDHTRLRGLVSPAFRRGPLTRLRPVIAGLAREHLAQLDRGGDAVRALTVPLPIAVIAELLGVPEERRGDLRHWSDAIIEGFKLRLSPAVLTHGWTLTRCLIELRTHVDEQLAAERGDDLFGALRRSVDAGDLTADEVFWFAVLLLVAGNETAASLLGTLLLRLAEHPDQYALLRERPALIPGAIEEALRHVAPIQGFHRTAVAPFGPIPQGDRVLLLYGAANRDPRKYPDPDAFLVERNPADNLGFGSGIHYCLGAHLARLQAQIVLEVLTEDVAELRLNGRPRWMHNPNVRGPAHLPLSARRASRSSRPRRAREPGSRSGSGPA